MNIERVSNITEKEFICNNKNNSKNSTKSDPFYRNLYYYLFNKVDFRDRFISSDKKVFPLNFQKNKISNSKYNLLTFIPKFLYYQFNTINNFFYLLLTITQFFDCFKIGYLITYIFPLLFILILSLLKELYQEIKIFIKDSKFNNSKYLVKRGNNFVKVKSKDIVVGDIIKLNSNDCCPVDIIILNVNNNEGLINVKTDQIDGETDWKIRKPLLYTHNTSSFNNNNYNWSGNISYEGPNDKIYNFTGEYSDSQNNYQKLNLEHTIWANMTITTGEVIGLAIYVGKETKISQNSLKSRIKVGKTDKEINYAALTLFIMIFIISILLLFMSGKMFTKFFILEFVRYIVLISSIIPISLKSNIDIAKIYYMLKINNSSEIKGTILRNSNISEEMGRIEYLLTDKTGTLTQNKMFFKSFSIFSKTIIEKDFKKIKKIISESNSESSKSSELLMKYKDSDIERIKDFLEFLVLCHNVTPIIENGERVLKASSPDEVAFINFSESMGYYLIEKTDKIIKISTPLNEIKAYKILDIFPFTSESKKMAIILENECNEIMLLIKGADTVINPLLISKESLFSYEQTENKSKSGLRTLVMAKKILSNKIYSDFKSELLSYIKANKDQNVLVNKISQSISLVGISGVEDLLQENVNSVITNIREAGIRVWMLTGDKSETAKCIGISTGFKLTHQKYYEIYDKEPVTIKQLLINFDSKSVLIISGESLSEIQQKEYLLKLFIKKSRDCEAVIICRCAPKQKAEIVQLIRNKFSKIVCAIGDGGNDVGMIQCSNFGIGIEGEEGKQAASAGDISILKFKYIENLFLWHGRNYYLRTCNICNFIIQRGFIISFVQILFMGVFYFISISVYNSFLLTLYSTFFTGFLILSLLKDEDIPVEQVFNYPILYKYVQNGKYLNQKTFMLWLFKSLYQSVMIFIVYLLCFNNKFNELITISFSCLIIIEIGNTFLLLRKWNFYLVVNSVITICLYVVTVYFCKTHFFFIETIDYKVIKRIGLLSGISLAPLFIIKFGLNWLSPNSIEKVIREAEKKNKRDKFLRNESNNINLI